VLDPQYVKRLNAGGGILGACIVLDGRVIGTWRRTLARDAVAIEIDLFEEAAPQERQVIEVAAQRYGGFHGLAASAFGPRPVKLSVKAASAAAAALKGYGSC